MSFGKIKLASLCFCNLSEIFFIPSPDNSGDAAAGGTACADASGAFGKN